VYLKLWHHSASLVMVERCVLSGGASDFYALDQIHALQSMKSRRSALNKKYDKAKMIAKVHC
jgi:hypothetical protein